MNRVLVCGSRDWQQRGIIRRVLTQLKGDGYSVLIHGAARGADSIAAIEGKALGYEVLAFPAEWLRHGKAAGPIRNQQMLDEGKPDLVVAFPLPGSIGTHDMMQRARRAGVRVVLPATQPTEGA